MSNTKQALQDVSTILKEHGWGEPIDPEEDASAGVSSAETGGAAPATRRAMLEAMRGAEVGELRNETQRALWDVILALEIGADAVVGMKESPDALAGSAPTVLRWASFALSAAAVAASIVAALISFRAESGGAVVVFLVAISLLVSLANLLADEWRQWIFFPYIKSLHESAISEQLIRQQHQQMEAILKVLAAIQKQDANNESVVAKPEGRKEQTSTAAPGPDDGGK